MLKKGNNFNKSKEDCMSSTKEHYVSSSIIEAEEEETEDMPETEFRKLIVRLLRSNQKLIHDLIEKCSQGIEILKRIQNEILDMKNSIAQIKNTEENINNRINEAEERISELEVKFLEITQTEHKKQGIPEGIETEKGLEDLLNEII